MKKNLLLIATCLLLLFPACLHARRIIFSVADIHNTTDTFARIRFARIMMFHPDIVKVRYANKTVSKFQRKEIWGYEKDGCIYRLDQKRGDFLALEQEGAVCIYMKSGYRSSCYFFTLGPDGDLHDFTPKQLRTYLSPEQQLSIKKWIRKSCIWRRLPLS